MILLYHEDGILKTHQTGPARAAVNVIKLLVLVPHRDARLLLQKWSGALFAAGLPGAWSFPWVAPLALLSGSLSPGELKHCALVLREQSLAGGNNGKIKTGPALSAAFPEGCPCGGAVFGPVLELAVPGEAFAANTAGKITRRFSPPVLGAALVCGSAGENRAVPPLPALFFGPPALSFRAAALAQMICRPMLTGDGVLPGCGCSFEWKIGKLYWLPPVKRDRRRGE
jgi:hypothetical protein